MNSEKIERKFSCPNNAHLEISNIRGSVKIQPGEKGVISVSAVLHKNSGDGEHTWIEIAQGDDESVKVKTHYDHNGFHLFHNRLPCKVDYEIIVPSECNLVINGVSNKTSVAGISGSIGISTVSGKVDCQSLGDQLSLKSVSGDIFGENLSGTAKIKTVSGDVSLKKCEFRKISGKTVSGDLITENLIGQGPFEFNSVSGDIHLGIHSSKGANISFSTISGGMLTSMPFNEVERTRNVRRIIIADGEADISFSSISGDIRIMGGEKENASLAHPEKQHIEDLTVDGVTILQKIESGELTVDQALQIMSEKN